VTTSTDRVAGDSFTGAILDQRYRLDALIGRGGMAVVYRGEDLALGRRVAVKVFAETAEGIDDAERRKSETGLLASLSHRALVHLYDAARDPASGREFLVMELIEGRDLRETLQLGPLGPADAAGMLADLAEALHVIHERGIVHRDVKPANVLLEPAHMPPRTWNAKLADFGIARLIDDARITRTGLLVGTPGYLSPEQVSGNPPTPAADIYALGLLVLEARTGETVFPGPAVEAASARLVRDPEIPESLGEDWVALLRAMTAREPEARPSAIDVAVAAMALEAPQPEPAVGQPSDDPVDLAGPAVGIADADTAAVADPAAAADADADADAATRVLPAPDRSFFGPTITRPETLDGERRRELARERRRGGVRRVVRPSENGAADDGTPTRSWVRPAIAISLFAAIAIVVIGVVFAALTAPTSTTELEPLPSVPGQLGVHLEELDEAVRE
jgi:eukaryotic-like serine/threonine-protein kinase